MVTHHEAAELQTGIFETTLGMAPQFYVGVVVFQVRGIRIGANITPFANYRVSQETIVAFIGMRKNYGITDLATNFGMRTNGIVAAHFGAHVNRRTFAKRKRAFN